MLPAGWALGSPGLDVRDTTTLETVATLYHANAVLAAVQADGLRAVTMGADGGMRVWVLATGVEITRLAADRPARALALSNNGRWLAALTGENRIDLWALAPIDLIAQSCRWLDPPCP